MNIQIRNAHEHNLRNISLNIPRNQLVVFTGLSGAGKSSLVFDTICREGQRQYFENLPSFVRKYLPKLERSKVEEISNLSPVVVIDQKRLGLNIRSTVGTVTELYTLLRLLYSRCGLPTIGDSNLFSFNTIEGACSDCFGLGQRLQLNPALLFDSSLSLNQGAIKQSEYRVGGRRWSILRASRMFDMDKKIVNFSYEEMDKLLYSPKINLKEDQGGFVQSFSFEGIVTGIMRRRRDKRGLSEKTLGSDSQYFEMLPCSTCHGQRLNTKALQVFINGFNITQVSQMELAETLDFISQVKSPLASSITAKMKTILQQLIGVGLGYLHLDQPVSSLSGGESQRVKMAKQLGSELTQIIYVLDEPTVGLHAQEVANLIRIMRNIRDKGNTVLVVEHDPTIIKAADYVIDLGPKAGNLGGELIYVGETKDFLTNTDSITALKIREGKLELKKEIRSADNFIKLKHAKINNLKNVSVNIPLGIFISVVGVSGSGKSSLICDVLCSQYPEIINIDQSTIGRMFRGSLATYADISGLIRKEFSLKSQQPVGLFSYNSLGACSACKGAGFRRIDMHFMPSVSLICEQCGGKRYNLHALSYKYQDKNIYEVMQLTVAEALSFFQQSQISKRLMNLQKVGLGYLALGQTLDTLSGGEAQRLKIASFLNHKGNIYVLDEPTTGLHLADIEILLKLLNYLVDQGNSVIVVEHNLNVIVQSDWIIELGPVGGKNGGQILYSGVPKGLSQCKNSHTGQYL